MTVILQHRDGVVRIDSAPAGRSRIRVDLHRRGVAMPRATCETKYPLELVEAILTAKGPSFLCDEITRDEDPGYVARHIRYDILSYVGEAFFDGGHVLDFGSGCGASTVLLARMFPRCQFTGLELEPRFVAVARLRARYYGLANVRFAVSADARMVPDGIGPFRAIVLSAVYEHLLPDERAAVLGALWSRLEFDGVLFANQTPHRFLPVESHTTGLPLINYLPDGAALWVARRFSPRVARNESWESLLRRGIRGGTTGRILRTLEDASRADGGDDGERPVAAVLMEPTRNGARDRIDLWYKMSRGARWPVAKWAVMVSSRLIRRLTGATITPGLSIAIRKERKTGGE
ncbi:MAG: class I SAM-dependent methyltransferase [Phycisphaerae bacterium]